MPRPIAILFCREVSPVACDRILRDFRLQATWLTTIMPLPISVTRSSDDYQRLKVELCLDETVRAGFHLL